MDRPPAFICHAREDCHTAQAVCTALERSDVGCFIAPRDIAPGHDYSEELVRGICDARVVVLILSSRSQVSPHVRRELDLAVSHNIPILALRMEDICVSAQMSYLIGPHQWLDASADPLDVVLEKSVKSVRGLLKSDCVMKRTGGADHRHDSTPERSPFTTQRASDKLSILSIDELLRLNWDYDRLVAELIGMDYDTLAPITEEDEGSAPQWLPLLMDHPDTYALLFNKEQDQIAGYWHFVSLFDEEYDKAKGGRLHDEEITADKVRYFALPGWHDIYMVMVCIRPQFRGGHATRLLFHALFDVLTEAADNGVFVRNICANAWTGSGEALCKSIGLGYECEHAANGRVFAAPFSRVLEHGMLKHYTLLKELYSAQAMDVQS